MNSKVVLILFLLIGFAGHAQNDSTTRPHTAVKRPNKITCRCQCHDGVTGFFHCWIDCCKWPNEPRIVPKKKKDE